MRIRDQSPVGIRESIDRILSQVADPLMLVDSRHILIKVNLCKPFPPESGATVDARVTEAVVDWMLNQNPSAKISIIESDTSRRTAKEAFEATGHSLLARSHKSLKLVNLSKTAQITIANGGVAKYPPHGFEYFKKGLKVSSEFLDCDYFISISKLKTHETEKITGILKNQFGCLSDVAKDKYHPYLPEVISDVNSVIKPDLSILDGIIAMEGEGPNFGTPKNMNLLIGGNDPVAVDAVASVIIGLDPLSVPVITTAARRGIGEIDLDTIVLSGEPLANVKTRFRFIPRSAFLFHRAAFAFQRIGDMLDGVGDMALGVGSFSERFARALYWRSFLNVVTRNSLALLAKRIRTPAFLSRFLIMLRLSFGRR